MTGMFADAIFALQRGDTVAAARAFEQVDVELSFHITAAAESKYQQGRIAKDAFRFSDAKALFERAVQLNPDEPKYLAALESITSVVGG